VISLSFFTATSNAKRVIYSALDLVDPGIEDVEDSIDETALQNHWICVEQKGEDINVVCFYPKEKRARLERWRSRPRVFVMTCCSRLLMACYRFKRTFLRGGIRCTSDAKEEEEEEG
jgi:hypothetical protein